MTSLIRCVILFSYGVTHDESESSEDKSELAFIDLPTLFLMTSFSLFVYYIAQLTIQLEME